MILKSGKFYDSAGNVVPLEFGNKEQLQIIASMDRMREEGEDPAAFFNENSGLVYYYYIECVACSKEVRFDWNKSMIGRKKTCGCGLTYYTAMGEYSAWVVKLK